ncbi:ABC transporter ATP-binding protein [Catenovulum adriaticum]|uniref:ABC transporter ATP-binding protein n=1 Tax=Catenovulum adriaticum TaxID=2984846 RepID=A0ABY7AKX5_9ALTE|nr:ABC transporter ATP-binding protein [Catenovulum sp. TS8]WAJ68966.1 ABC transporter ATP-binding protein [Catenovulum sp. TS8]
MTALLSVKQLSWQTQHKSILSDLNFELNAGSINAIVGPNGAGKTSLLRCLYRQISDYQGYISLSGQPVEQLKHKMLAQQIAVVNQHSDIHFTLSVYEIVCMGLIPHLSLFSQINSVQKQWVDKVLAQLDITDFKDRVFNRLSGGEQQRVLIARALVQQPQLLILDEPTNHLDVHFQHQILSLVNQLGVCVLMTLHDLNLAAYYADNILLLNQGKLVASGVPEQVLTPKLIQQVFELPVSLGINPLNKKQHVYFAAPENKVAIFEDQNHSRRSCDNP